MIELEGVPELIDPVMVAAFEGWNDAGDAASTAVAHLDKEWKGEVFAALDAEDYYDFQVNRPLVGTTEACARSRGRRQGCRSSGWAATSHATWCSSAASNRPCAGARSATSCWVSPTNWAWSWW